MVLKWIVLAVVCIVVLVVFLLFFPVKVNLELVADAKENIVAYCVKIFCFRLLCGRMWVGKTGFVVENQHGRFQGNEQDAKAVPGFVSRLFTKLDFVNMFVAFEVGKKDDAMTSALSCGAIETVFAIVFALLKANNHDSVFERVVCFDVGENKLNFFVDGLVVVTFFDAIKSFASARIDITKRAQTIGCKEKKNGQHN